MKGVRPFLFTSPAERRQADLFWADLVGEAGIAPGTVFEFDSGESLSETGEDTLAGLTEGEELRTWPTLGALPDSFVDQIVANRGRVTSRASELRQAPGGYYAFGRNIPPSVVCTPDEDQNPRLKELITRLNAEVAGEGRTSSVMTGDRAGFTWGRGLAHGGSLEAWVNEWFTASPQARDALLDLGITLSGTTWKIVDTATKVVKVGEQAIAHVNGREPADTKKLLLSIFMNVAEQFGTEAANAQWNVTKRNFFYNKVYGPPKEIIDNPTAWSAKAVCYVIHCGMWGSFAGWQRFKATGGDSKKILRLEVEYTRFYEKKETFILVPPRFGQGGAISPSGTMLLNMGARYMIDDHIVEPLNALADAQKGDVVFQMDPAASKQPLYVLRGVPVMYDPQEELMDEILSVHHFSMTELLKYFDKVRDKGGRNKGYARLKAMRDFYASDQNRRKEAVGPRPRIAMDAVLHRDEGQSGTWILDQCQSAKLPPDQVELIKKKVGIP
jgi:hypothetical protein